MHKDAARALYGPAYAARYDTIWQEHSVWRAEADNYIRSLAEHMGPDTSWLDVGCGTGWFLSQFPGVRRGGIDLSPAMLEQAQTSNPDAAFFREGDIRDDVPEWHDAFSLVSSTGQAWGYVDSLGEVEQIARNMASWTAPDGVLYVQPPDLFDLTGHELDYDFTGVRPPHNTTRVTGAIWCYYDEGGVHENQVWPSLDVWVRWLAQWFRRVEVHTWPHDPPAPYLAGPRKLLLARDKRATGDDTEAEIVVFPPPATAAPARAESVEIAVGDDTSGGPDPEPVGRGDDGPAGGSLTDEGRAIPAAGARIPDRRLVDQPLSYLLSRVRPTDPKFWRSGIRRVGRKLR